MKIIGVACVKNESDIIEAFVRHNLRYLDELILLDHGSTDATSTILRQLKAEGLPLSVEWDPSLGKFQGEKMTRLMRLAAQEHAADWVLLLDADEFIKCSGNNLSLPVSEDSQPFLKIPSQTYCVHHDDDPDILNPAERLRHRLAKEPSEDKSLEERRYYLKGIIPRHWALRPGSTVIQGNHYILVANAEPPHELYDGFCLAHFSLRTSGQYASKISIDLLQQSYKSSAQANMDSFYVPHYEQVKTDFDVFSKNFQTMTPSYFRNLEEADHRILDPLAYRGGPLRYTSPSSDHNRLINNLLHYAETQAWSLADHAAKATPDTQRTEEVAIVSCSIAWNPDWDTAPSRNISLPGLGLSSLQFPLQSKDSSPHLSIQVAGIGMIGEIRSIRLYGEQSAHPRVLTGSTLKDSLQGKQNICPIFHQHYFCFIKASGPAILKLDLPGDWRHPVSHAEIDIHLEIDGHRITSRLFQNHNLDKILETSLEYYRIRYLLEKRSSLWGAVKHQLDCLRKKAPWNKKKKHPKKA